MWIKNADRRPEREDNYPVRRKTTGSSAFLDDVCAWIPNHFTRRTHGVWVNIRTGNKLYDVLEWWCSDE